MKICVVGHSLVIKKYQKPLMQIREKGHKVFLITPNLYKEGGRIVKVDYSNETIHHLSLNVFMGKLGQQNLHFYYNLVRIISYVIKFKPDICYLYEEPHSLVTTQFTIFYKLFSKKTKIIIWTSNNRVQNFFTEYMFCDPRKYLLSLNEWFNYKYSDAIIAISKYASDVLIKKKYLKKIFIVSTHFINLEHFDYKLKIRNKKGDNIIIGFIGRINEQKGLDILINAIADLGQLYLDKKKIKLLFIGRGEKYIKNRNRAKELDIDRYIKWENFISYESMPEEIGKMDILVVPSRQLGGIREKFGRVVIEAMAMKTAVIVSDSGYLPLLVNRKELIFKENDFMELSKKLKVLINSNDLRREHTEYFFKMVKTKYTDKAVADRLLNIFYDLIKGI